MLRASEARDICKTCVSVTTEEELVAAEKSVLKAVNEGMIECWHYGELHEQALDQLRLLGYNISRSTDQRDGFMFKIKWA